MFYMDIIYVCSGLMEGAARAPWGLWAVPPKLALMVPVSLQDVRALGSYFWKAWPGRRV